MLQQYAEILQLPQKLLRILHQHPEQNDGLISKTVLASLTVLPICMIVFSVLPLKYFYLHIDDIAAYVETIITACQVLISVTSYKPKHHFATFFFIWQYF